jgi:DNA-directed RNA polymerase specialized sigma54-like protein
MNIAVDQAQEAEDGEEVLGRAGKLEVRIGLKRITLTATRISVRVQEDFFSRDKATAREIIRHIAAISEDMESTVSRKLSRKG